MQVQFNERFRYGFTVVALCKSRWRQVAAQSGPSSLSFAISEMRDEADFSGPAMRSFPSNKFRSLYHAGFAPLSKETTCCVQCLSPQFSLRLIV